MNIPDIILAIISLALVLCQVASRDVWWTAEGFESGKGWEGGRGSASLISGGMGRSKGASELFVIWRGVSGGD